MTRGSNEISCIINGLYYINPGRGRAPTPGQRMEPVCTQCVVPRSRVTLFGLVHQTTKRCCDIGICVHSYGACLSRTGPGKSLEARITDSSRGQRHGSSQRKSGATCAGAAIRHHAKQCRCADSTVRVSRARCLVLLQIYGEGLNGEHAEQDQVGLHKVSGKRPGGVHRERTGRRRQRRRGDNDLDWLGDGWLSTPRRRSTGLRSGPP